MRLLLFCSFLGMALVALGSDRATLAEFTGRKLLKSVDGGYLRAAFRGPNDRREYYVDTTSRRKHCTKWHVEERNGRVALKSAYFKDMYMHANEQRIVDLENYIDHPSFLWIPVKKEGGKWALRSGRDNWLQFKPDGNVTLQERNDAEGQFYLEDW